MKHNTPKHIDESFDNLNELMNAMTTEGQKNLDIYEDKMGKLNLTNYGCVIHLKNSKGKGFSVLVMDTDDPDVFRKRIIEGAKTIHANYPSLVAS